MREHHSMRTHPRPRGARHRRRLGRQRQGAPRARLCGADAEHAAEAHRQLSHQGGARPRCGAAHAARAPARPRARPAPRAADLRPRLTPSTPRPPPPPPPPGQELLDFVSRSHLLLDPINLVTCLYRLAKMSFSQRSRGAYLQELQRAPTFQLLLREPPRGAGRGGGRAAACGPHACFVSEAVQRRGAAQRLRPPPTRPPPARPPRRLHQRAVPACTAAVPARARRAQGRRRPLPRQPAVGAGQAGPVERRGGAVHGDRAQCGALRAARLASSSPQVRAARPRAGVGRRGRGAVTAPRARARRRRPAHAARLPPADPPSPQGLANMLWSLQKLPVAPPQVVCALVRRSRASWGPRCAHRRTREALRRTGADQQHCARSRRRRALLARAAAALSPALRRQPRRRRRSPPQRRPQRCAPLLTAPAPAPPRAGPSRTSSRAAEADGPGRSRWRSSRPSPPPRRACSHACSGGCCRCRAAATAAPTRGSCWRRPRPSSARRRSSTSCGRSRPSRAPPSWPTRPCVALCRRRRGGGRPPARGRGAAARAPPAAVPRRRPGFNEQALSNVVFAFEGGGLQPDLLAAVYEVAALRLQGAGGGP